MRPDILAGRGKSGPDAGMRTSGEQAERQRGERGQDRLDEGFTAGPVLLGGTVHAVQQLGSTPMTGEFFLAGGWYAIQMRDRAVVLWTRELFVAPRGVEHCPPIGAKTTILPSEPGGVVNTGDLGGELIAEAEEWA